MCRSSRIPSGKIIHSAEKQAELDRVNTIKPRHLEAAIGSQVDENTSDDDVSSQVEEDVLDAHVKGSALTPNAIRGIAKSFAGMPITDDAVEELLLLYYDVVDETEENIRKHAQLGSNPAAFIQSIDRMRELMMLGWMRRMLKRALTKHEKEDTNELMLNNWFFHLNELLYSMKKGDEMQTIVYSGIFAGLMAIFVTVAIEKWGGVKGAFWEPCQLPSYLLQSASMQ